MILVVCVTILLIYDYFPDIPFARAVPLELLIVVMLGLFIVTVYRNRKQNSSQTMIFRSQVFFLIYVVALLALLTAMGGDSQVGIGFDNGIFWVALAIALLEISFQRRRMKQADE